MVHTPRCGTQDITHSAAAVFLSSCPDSEAPADQHICCFSKPHLLHVNVMQVRAKHTTSMNTKYISSLTFMLSKFMETYTVPAKHTLLQSTGCQYFYSWQTPNAVMTISGALSRALGVKLSADTIPTALMKWPSSVTMCGTDKSRSCRCRHHFGDPYEHYTVCECILSLHILHHGTTHMHVRLGSIEHLGCR